MNRRELLKGLAALVGGIAIEEAIPFGRVWSFPKEIKVRCPDLVLSAHMLSRETLLILTNNLKLEALKDYKFMAGEEWVGNLTEIRKPARYVGWSALDDLAIGKPVRIRTVQSYFRPSV